MGAGAFGGWTALHLVRAGVRVTLIDMYGPGNSRASSGGESRIIRGTYGPSRTYVEMVVRSLQLWTELERRWNRKLLHRTGMLWMVGEADRYEQASLPVLRAADITFEQLSAAELGRRFPQLNPEGVRWAIYEPDAGYLKAWPSCVAVLEGFLAEGGEYRRALARPGTIAGNEMQDIRLSDNTILSADAYVFACGPWLGKLFPEVLGNLIFPTRQEVYYFGVPGNSMQYVEGHIPAWIDNSAALYYGMPATERHGFKIADDARGAPFDPDSGERVPSPDLVQAARAYLAFRFPGLADAPLIESRVCQYENTPDTDFIIDRHPTAQNVWLVGGGSGHGFKHGPVVGERAAQGVLGTWTPEPMFRLSRFAR